MPKDRELVNRRNEIRDDIEEQVSKVNMIKNQDAPKVIGFIRYKGKLFKGMGTTSEVVRRLLRDKIWSSVSHGLLRK